MAGIYIHIPFCKQKCSYCAFHFSTRLIGMEDMHQSLLREIESRREEIAGMAVKTIYFGGGTPSLWSVEKLNELIGAIRNLTTLDQIREVTLEANPDDLSEDYVRDLKNHSPVNRLSIGIQSFQDTDLQLMNRAHNAGDARAALDRVFKAGFEEITTDLIFGLPGSSTTDWLWQLEQMTSYPIRHLSCYNLTIEDKTTLKHQIQRGMITLPDDEGIIDQFYTGIDYLATQGFIQYEISNYGQEGHFAIHNTQYWQNEPYIGIGPSAHSYDGSRRRWNIANNIKYNKALASGDIFWESEELDEKDRYNEYLLTGLRTMWGIREEVIHSFSEKIRDSFYKQLPYELQLGNIQFDHGIYTLTRNGKGIADRIISDFFYV